MQDFLSDREQGHGKLNALAASGDLLISIAPKEQVNAVRAKVSSAREDWKTLMTNLHQRETALQVLFLKFYSPTNYSGLKSYIFYVLTIRNVYNVIKYLLGHVINKLDFPKQVSTVYFVAEPASTDEGL